MPTKKQNYVCVSGYGWSGSGACIDILKEFDGFGSLQGEFRIAKDPYGLADLEGSLIHNWDPIRSDVSIRNFISYCEVLGRKANLLNKVGKDFSNKLNIDFMLESRLYIFGLTSMMYLGDTSVHRYNIPAYKNIVMKIKSRLGKGNAKLMYFSKPKKTFFIHKTREYVDGLFRNYMDLKRINTLILDQAVSPNNIIKTQKYFENAKVIIIDRDPRDVYVELTRNKKLIGPELSIGNSVEKYIKWYIESRSASIEDINDISMDEYVLRLHFEDLVLESDKSIEKIIKFLGNNDVHNNKGRYFNPYYSIKNIGLWKNYDNQDVMNTIGNELRKYCYRG